MSVQLFNLFDGADGGGVDDDLKMTPGDESDWMSHFGCLCPWAVYAQSHPATAAN